LRVVRRASAPGDQQHGKEDSSKESHKATLSQ
jgi:hypothetical protein